MFSLANYTLLKPFICLSGILICSASCAVSKNKTATAAEPQKTTKAATPPPYQPSRTKEWELKHTKLDLTFDFAQRTASGHALLQMHPYFYNSDSIVLDAVGMQIDAVETMPVSLLDSYHYDNERLHIKLKQAVKKEDLLNIHIKYTARPYSVKEGGTDAIRSDKGLFFINTRLEEPQKPMQIWTQGETQANSKWFPTFDSPNFKTTLDLTMHVPDTLVTLSNGLLKTSIKEANGMRADRWVQDIPFAPYLAMMAVGDFAVQKDTWKGKEVAYYVPKAYGPYARNIFNHTPEMMQFFSDRLGVPYPWDKYSQVVGYNYVSGAMENVTASLFGSFNLKNDSELADAPNDFIVAHELFHQWFGDYVTCESWGQLTVNESFADYSEYLWTEYKYGPNRAEEIWQNAMNRYLSQAAKNDPSLVRYHYQSAGEMFDRVSYNKGGRTLHYLRNLLGDEAFFAGLKEYLTQHKLSTAEATDLRLAFEKVSGKDWKWFFDEWYFRAGHPKLELQYQYDNAAQQMTVVVKQQQNDSIGLYHMPLKAQLISDKGTETIDWTVNQKEQVFTYPYVNGKAPVFVPDAMHWLPGEIKVIKPAAPDVRAILQKSSSYISKRNALADFLNNNPDATQRNTILKDALADTISQVRLYALQGIDLSTKADAAAFTAMVAALAENDPSNKVRAAAFYLLTKVYDTKYTAMYEQAISSPSYIVAGSALMALYAQNHKLAYDHAVSLKASDPRDQLLYVSYMVLAKEGRSEDYPYLQEQIVHNYDGVRSTLITHFGTYLLQSRDLETYTRGLAFLRKIQNLNEGANKEGINQLLKDLDKNLDNYIKLNTSSDGTELARKKKALLK